METQREKDTASLRIDFGRIRAVGRKTEREFCLAKARITPLDLRFDTV